MKIIGMYQDIRSHKQSTYMGPYRPYGQVRQPCESTSSSQLRRRKISKLSCYRSISGGYGSGIAQLVAANQADYRYENVIVDTANSDTSDTTVDVSDNTDPFDGFEEAIKNSEVIRIRKNVSY